MSQKTVSDKDVLMSLGMDPSSYSEFQVLQALSIMKKAARVISEVVVNPSSIDSFDGKLEEYGIPKGKMRELVLPFLGTSDNPSLATSDQQSKPLSVSQNNLALNASVQDFGQFGQNPPPKSSSLPLENKNSGCELITKKEFSQFQERIFSLLENRLHNPVRIVRVVKEEKTAEPAEEKEKEDEERKVDKEKDGEESEDDDDSDGAKRKKRRLRVKRVRPICDLSRFGHIVEQLGNTLTWRNSTGVNICLQQTFTRGIYNISFRFKNCVSQSGNITVGICTPEWADNISEGQFMGNDSGSLDWNRKEGIFHDQHRSEAPKFEDDEEIALELDMNRRLLFFIYHGTPIPLCYNSLPSAVKVGFFMNKIDCSCFLAVLELKRSSVTPDRAAEFEQASW